MNSTACLTILLKDFLYGVKDSLIGAGTVNKIDECVFSEQKNVPKKPSIFAMSTLAKKRAEKQNINASNEENTVLITKQKKSVSARLTDCCVTNGILGCLAYAIAFFVIRPGLKYLYSSATGELLAPTWAKVIWWLCCNFYFVLVLLFTKVLNFLWFQDIAEVSYRKVRGRPQMEKLGLLIADLAFTLFLQTLFFVQAIVVSILIHHFICHVIAEMVYLTHLVLLQSLYTFEYKWFQMSWTANKRMSYIENHWPYFLGFGLLQGCVIYFIPSFYASTFLIALFFPFMIVSANEAKTIPTPVSYPLRIFYPVGQLTDILFQYCLKYKSSYFQWLSPFIAFITKIFLRLFSHVNAPACYIFMGVSITILGVINLCKRHKVTTLIITIVLVIIIAYSIALDLHFSHSS